MAASKKDIAGWLREAAERGATHLIVVCDTFDWIDHPVFVLPGEDVRSVYKQYHGVQMQKVMEVYSTARDPEEQLAEHRAFHFD